MVALQASPYSRREDALIHARMLEADLGRQVSDLEQQLRRERAARLAAEAGLPATVDQQSKASGGRGERVPGMVVQLGWSSASRSAPLRNAAAEFGMDGKCNFHSIALPV